MTDNTQMMTKLNWHLSIGIHMRKEGSSCQKCGHQGNAGEGDDEFETDEHIGGSDVEDGDNSDIGGGDDNTVDDNEEDGSLIV